MSAGVDEAEMDAMDARRVGVYVAHHADGEVVHLANDVGALIAALREARAVLREVEWRGEQGEGGFGGPSCPCCAGLQEDRGHEADCRLAFVFRVTSPA